MQLSTSPYIRYIKYQGTTVKIESWLIDDEFVVIDISFCIVLVQCLNPQPIELLYQQYGEEVINLLCEKKLLIQTEDLWEQSNIKLIEIECTTFCNYRCEYCTIPVEPRSYKILDMSLFKLIVEKATKHASIQLISINNYGEPSIDPLLEARLDLICQTKLRLVFNTNGSHIEPFLERLSRMKKNVYVLNVNIPSVNSEEYHHITGGNLGTVLKNVRKANDLGLNVKIVVNGKNDEIEKKYVDFVRMFKSYENVEIYKWKTNDRAGILKNKYCQNVKNHSPFSGCRNLVNYLFVDGYGDLFICCNDYHKRYIYGNIKNGEIENLLRSPQLIELKQIVFGAKTSVEKFICNNCAEMQESLYMSNIWQSVLNKAKTQNEIR